MSAKILEEAEHTTDRKPMEPDKDRNQFKALVADRLIAIRGPRSQEWIAERGGVHQQTIWRYERGDIPSSWAFLARLREVEGIDLNTLLEASK